MSHELKAITGILVPSGSLIQGTLASGTVTSGSIGAGAVVNGNIASGQVGTFQIASGAITGNLIASGAVASVDLADNSVVSGKIASGSVSWFALGSGVVNSGNLGVNSVVSGNIASGAVGLFGLASGVVVSGIIGNNAVNSGNISSGAVGLYQLGVASGTVEGKQLTLDPDTGMLTWQSPQTTVARVKNGTAAIISGLAVVYISGGAGANPFVAPAQANADLTSLATFGVAAANIGANAEGTVVTQGILTNVNTSAFNDGDVLFLSPTVAGAVTNVKPQAPDHLVLVGYVTNAANNGTIEVAIQNGYEIDELHDVKILSGSLQSGQVLQWSSGVWWNQAFVAGSNNLGSGSVTSGAIASGQVGLFALASGVVAGLIGSGSVTSGDLGLGAVNNINIASGTVANDKLANSTITIDGSSTALGGTYNSQALTTASGLLAGTYYPSGALTVGIASGGITSQMLADGSVNTSDIASGAVGTNQIASGAITTNQLASGAISTLTLGSGQVTTNSIASGAVDNTKLANNSITIAGSSTALGTSWAAQSLTAASGLSSVTYYPSGSAVFGIASGGIVAQMMGSGSVTTNAIASGSVTANALASGTIDNFITSGLVGSGDLGIGAVNNLNIASGTVANDKLANSTITIDGSSTALGGTYNSQALTTSSGLLAGTYYPSGALTVGIASGGITSQMLADGSVNTSDIASGAVGTNQIASGAVTSGNIGNNAVNSGNISSGAVGLYHLGVASGIANGKQLTVDPDTGMMVWSYPNALSTRVKNGTGSIISGMAVVYISGGVGANPLVGLAQANQAAASFATFGVATTNIGANSDGFVIVQGVLNNVNTSAFSDGDVLWLSPTVPGGITKIKPQAPEQLVSIGFVTNAAINGAIEIVIRNGYELEELDNVKILSGSLQSGQILQYSSGLWWNQNYVVGATNLGSGSVTSGAIASGQVGPSALASGVITQLIISGSVQSGDLGTGAVNNINVASGTLSNDKLVNSIVTIAGSSTALGASWAAAALTTSSGLLAGTYYPSGALTVGIASGGITSQMLADGSVTTSDIASGAVGTNQIASGAVTGTNIAATTVANTNLVNSTVTIAGSSTALGGSWAAAALTTSSGLLAGTYYPSGALTIGIASGGITAQMIGSGAITSGAIASGQVGSNALASGVIAGLIVSGSVGSGDLGLGAVNNENIASGTVANDKLANSTVTIAGSSTALGGSWVAQSLVHASGLSAVTYYPSGSAVVGIASGGIVAQMMGSGSVTTNAIASGSVTANSLASGAVSDIVGSGSVTSGDLGIGAVNNLNIASGTVANDKLTNSTVTIAGSSTALGGTWAAAALTTSSGLLAGTYYPSGALTIGIASGGIQSQMLANGSVTSGAIASGQVGPYQLASGAVNLLLTSGIIVSGMIGNSTINSGNIASGSIGQFHQSQLLIPKMQAPGRLSLYSGAPIVSGGYISGASKVYYNPYNGSTISLFDGVSWLEYEASDPIALDLSGGFQSGLMYDIFINGNAGISGSVVLSSQSWTSGANRPPIIYKNGIPLSQFTNARYLGTIRTTTSSTTEDSKFRRFVWNYDNRIQQSLYYTDSTQHTYNTETPRVWNLNSGTRLEFIQGVAGIGASASCFVASYVTPGATSVNSFESEGVFSGTNYNVYNTFTGLFWSNSVLMVGNCNVGYNYLQLMESCQSGTVTNVSMTLTGLIEG